MKNQKLFVSDLDGTLLQSDGALSDYSRGALTELLEDPSRRLEMALRARASAEPDSADRVASLCGAYAA